MMTQALIPFSTDNVTGSLILEGNTGPLLSKCNVDLVSSLPPISCVSRWSPCVYWLKHSQSAPAVSFPLCQASSSISICGILRCPKKSVAGPVFYSGAVVNNVLAAKCARPVRNSLCTSSPQPGQTSGNHLSPLPWYLWDLQSPPSSSPR